METTSLLMPMPVIPSKSSSMKFKTGPVSHWASIGWSTQAGNSRTGSPRMASSQCSDDKSAQCVEPAPVHGRALLHQAASATNAWRKLGCAATFRLTCSAWTSTFFAMVVLALALAIPPGFMRCERSGPGWTFQSVQRLSVGGLSAVVDMLDMLGVTKGQLTPAHAPQAGFVWLLSKNTSPMSKVHEVSHIELKGRGECESPAGSVHVRETEQPNNIVSRPPPHGDIGLTLRG